MVGTSGDNNVTESRSTALSSECRSASTWKTERITGYHDFKVDGYSIAKGIGIGKCISSDVFTVGGYSWKIKLYPDGLDEQSKDYISVFLERADPATDIRAGFELTLFVLSGDQNNMSMEFVPHTFKEEANDWGCVKFVKRTDLEAFGYLKDDCLHFGCRIILLQPHTGYPSPIPLPTSNIVQHIGRLLESGEGADIKFQVEEEFFSAHKTILAARSPVFNAQFFGSMKHTNDQCIKVEDMKVPVFKALLHFIYWDDLPNLEALTGIESKEASTLMSQYILAAADRYNLDQLVLICASKLCNDITIETVTTILTLAGRHNCLPLKSACFKFLALTENLQGVIKTEDWKYLKESSPHLCVELLEYITESKPYVPTT